MTLVVFVGPTLAPQEIAAGGDFVCLPPVTQGDLYRAARLRPRAVGVIDGYFSGAPSVWHKEILWTISQGIPVFGSSSMGALRAAELHAFGMRGVGRIFESFRDGALEDDDEVAIVHGPAELNYLVASEAMVNIRATLACAEAEGFLSAASRRALEDFGKSLFFPKRSWEALLENAVARGVSRAEQSALSDWLPRGRIDQKRVDALAMLTAMAQAAERPRATQTIPNFVFEWTYLWDAFVRKANAAGEGSLSIQQERILDELRLEGPDAYQRVETMALLRLVAASGATPPELSRPPADLQATLAQLRARLGLFSRRDFDRWIAHNDLDAALLENLVANERSVEDLRERLKTALGSFLLDGLRIDSAYARFADRARRKDDELARSTAPPSGSLSSIGLIGLRLWFFEQRLGRTMPDDLEHFVRRLGYARVADFDAALYRELLYLEARRDDRRT
jgi:hypothetical protein